MKRKTMATNNWWYAKVKLKNGVIQKQYAAATSYEEAYSIFSKKGLIVSGPLEITE